MVRVAREHPVLLVNSIGMRMPVPGRESKILPLLLRKARSTLHYLARPEPQLPNLAVFTPIALPLYGDGWLARRASDLLYWQVRAASRWVGLREPAVVVTPPTALRVAERLPRSCLIYNRSDKHSEFPEADQARIEVLERQLIRRADRVLYVSKALYEQERELAGDHGILFDHGVDVDLFRPLPAEEEPPDLAMIPSPRMGFFGGLRTRLIDYELLDRLARELPEVQLVLIGSAEGSVQTLDRHANVHLLGQRPYSEVPRYGSFFDVGLMPYRNVDWIRYSNPIKLKEYLALGLPVVSSNFPAAARYEGAIHIAANHEEFVSGVRAALADPLDAAGRARRRALVENDTWDRRTAEFLELVRGAASRV